MAEYRVRKGCSFLRETGAVLKEGTVFQPTGAELEAGVVLLELVVETPPKPKAKPKAKPKEKEKPKED